MSEAKTINIDDFRQHESDTGSSHVQIARLTERILHLTAHMGSNRKDFSSRRGLLKLVARRRKLLDYVKRENEEQYKELIQKLGLRK
ncbi:30S ribosomal protein S15 [Sulfuriroseicoccus oceanibius]|uniref:Small ribosomal subunit protein uS15 n=1 Tax=Sulfuriroseicoccus oceanibius TaxID=2707525 RepID=A0A6B3L9T6_9BACT|nr:30S ribosomal protein S15 [Sulfuriroseicoccus oceanibius]QQL46315.1 30S ribosomal protein S15 [Sulfuriroseicoccus oceanibius]